MRKVRRPWSHSPAAPDFLRIGQQQAHVRRLHGAQQFDDGLLFDLMTGGIVHQLLDLRDAEFRIPGTAFVEEARPRPPGRGSSTGSHSRSAALSRAKSSPLSRPVGYSSGLSCRLEAIQQGGQGGGADRYGYPP